MSKFSFVLLSIFVVGCTADQLNRSDAWLARPVTTRPGAPTNEQSIQATSSTVGSLTGPYGAFAATLLNVGLIAYHEYASRRRTDLTQGLIVESSSSSPKV